MTTNTKRFITGLSVVSVMLALATLFFLPSTPRPAPNVIFKTIGGEQISLASLRGQPILVNFWASNCGYCLEEMPHLATLHRDLSGKGLHIIGVAMPYDIPSHVVQISKRLNIPYPIAIDPNDTVAKAFGNVRFTPTSFLINANGMIIDKTTGRINLNSLRKQINKLLTNQIGV
jgi:thiol-disulfide isomerase/thioredoxin